MHIRVVLCVPVSLVQITVGTFICINDGMFENSDNQRTFWHCVHGTAYLKPCPAYQIWSQVKRQCIWDGKCFFTSLY